MGIPSATPSCFGGSKKPNPPSACATLKDELHDPIEDNQRIRPIIREVERRAEKESTVRGDGRCHDVWARMEQILKNEHGITWFPPSSMNTDLIYD